MSPNQETDFESAQLSFSSTYHNHLLARRRESPRRRVPLLSTSPILLSTSSTLLSKSSASPRPRSRRRPRRPPSLSMSVSVHLLDVVRVARLRSRCPRRPPSRRRLRGPLSLSTSASSTLLSTSSVWPALALHDRVVLLALEVGRVVFLNDGPSAGKMVVIDGPTTDIIHQLYPYRHLVLTPLRISSLPHSARTGIVASTSKTPASSKSGMRSRGRETSLRARTGRGWAASSALTAFSPRCKGGGYRTEDDREGSTRSRHND